MKIEILERKLVSKLEIAGAPERLTVFTSEYGSRGSCYNAVHNTIPAFQGCTREFMREHRTVVYVYSERLVRDNNEKHGMPGGIGI